MLIKKFWLRQWLYCAALLLAGLAAACGYRGDLHLPAEKIAAADIQSERAFPLRYHRDKGPTSDAAGR